MKKYFEGWYFKHQNQSDTLCLIPGRSEDTAFIQVITNNASYSIDFPLETYKESQIVSIGDNHFSSHGISLSIATPEITLSGKLQYNGITPLCYDIMGPFARLPMQCHHSIISMHHQLQGQLMLNGSMVSFDHGIGYIEGDRGRSFPKEYTWVHCNAFAAPCSVTLAIAHIPFGLFTFTGCICVVWHKGKEYRLATYRGVRIRNNARDYIELSQGDYRLTVEVAASTGNRLLAPQNGVMSRSIHESASVDARFTFWEKNICLFDYSSDYASFEHVLKHA